jgi:hypothetical protein
MRILRGACLLCLSVGTTEASAQLARVEPRVATQTELGEKVAVVEVAPRFVTAIRLPEAVNSVVVGDPSAFQVEHSEHEPRLVFVKSLSTKPAESNLLISIVGGREFTLLLVSRGEQNSAELVPVDFLLKYEVSGGFLIRPSAFPAALIGPTVPLNQAAALDSGHGNLSTRHMDPGGAKVSPLGDPPGAVRIASTSDELRSDTLDQLVRQQERAPLPALYGQRIEEQTENGDRVRAGVGRVIDGGQEVVVLFSVLNQTKHSILLMPPQVQLGGRTISGKLVRHAKRSTAEQLPVLDFRLNRRRLGPSERADGVVVFERPPYKQSNETLLLQVAESGAVDRPALAPIGFGVSTQPEERNDGRE